MLWPRAVIWERYEEYTAYPDYRDPRDRIWGIPNYVGGYEEWLVRSEVLARERSAQESREVEGETLFEAGNETVSSPAFFPLLDLREIITTGPEEMARSRRAPLWPSERRRGMGRGGRGFSPASPPPLSRPAKSKQPGESRE
jgi:hypothetical protein